MPHYKYYISHEKDGYKFGLYPNNNNKQWVVISNAYPTYQQAKVSMVIFQNRVALQQENAFIIQKLEVGKYKLAFVDKQIEVAYIEKYPSLCKKKMERIIKNVNAPLEVQEK